jgi:hypothetical protein
VGPSEELPIIGVPRSTVWAALALVAGLSLGSGRVEQGEVAMRRIFVLLAVLAMTVTTQQASGITGAAPDGGAHPYVGALIGHPPEGGLDVACSGFLIAPKVFLTAGHCTAGVGSETELPFVTFADPVDLENPSTLIQVEALVTHPGFNPLTLANDFGVALLKKRAPAGVTPVGLPSEGLLDTMRAGGSLPSFVMVSYGVVVDCSTRPCAFSIDGSRHVASAPVVKLLSDFVFIRNGVCSKDSGSPQLLPPATPGTPVVAGAVTNSAFGCAQMGGATRLDTSSALDFLEPYAQP